MSPLLGLAVAAAVLAALVLPALGRRRAERLRGEEDVRLRGEAAATGLRYERAGANPGASPAAAGATPGAQIFSGNTGGHAWTAEVEVYRSEGRGRPTRERTRFTFPSARAAQGKFVLVIGMPPGTRPPPLGELPGGLLGRLVAKAAEAFLDLYVNGFFGPQHRALVNVEGADRPAAPDGLWVLSTDPALAAKLLAPANAPLLEALRGVKGAAAGFGLLATPAGLVFGVQARFLAASEVREGAARVAPLAEKLRW